MKKGLKIATIIGLFSVSTLSIAEISISYETEAERVRKMTEMCGMKSQLGQSSIFGNRDNYSVRYPKVGRLLDEMESLNNHMPLLSLSKAKELFSKSKDYQDAMIKSYDMAVYQMENHRSSYVNKSKETYDYVFGRYESVLKDSISQKEYNDAKTVEDVTTLMNGGDRILGTVNFGYNKPTDYDKYVFCTDWWYNDKGNDVDYRR